MGKVIAVTNQKGGVGKTTSCINICCALALAGKKVLLCDIDPQGNCTSGYGIDKNRATPNVYDVLINNADVSDAVRKTKYGDIIPSNKNLAGATVELVSVKQREFVLKKALAEVKDRYDFIFIDCPPSLELLTLNALCAADSILVPVQCEYFALEGLSDLMTTVRTVKKRLNPSLQIEGVLLTMYDSRTNFSAQVASEVKKYFRDKVYSVTIPRNVRLSEAPSHGKPAVVYDKSSRGAVAYIELAKEIMEKGQ